MHPVLTLRNNTVSLFSDPCKSLLNYKPEMIRTIQSKNESNLTLPVFPPYSSSSLLVTTF